MSSFRVRSLQTDPLNTFVYLRQDLTTVSAPNGREQHPLTEYIPFSIDYDSVSIPINPPPNFRCNMDFMTPALDQESCGSCWAFSTCSSLSDRINVGCNRRVLSNALTPTIPLTCNYFYETNQEKIFDVQYVKTLANLQNILDNLACHGNSVVLTCFFLQTWGTFRQKCAPYRSANLINVEYDKTNFGFRSSLALSSNVDFSSDVNTVTCGAFFGNIGRSVNASSCLGRLIIDNKVYAQPAQTFRCLLYYSIDNCVSKHENIMKDIMIWGPCVTSFRVYSDFYDFDPDIDSVYVSNQDPATIVGGHAVSICGWGEEVDPKTKKTTPYWWIKNSWGTGYGEGGYFKMLRGSNHCGVEENVVGMVPNCYPQNVQHLTKIMKNLKSKWNFQEQLSPLFLQLYKSVLSEYSLISKKLADVLFRDEMIQKYPIIDYFFFNMPFRALFQLNPKHGYSRFNEFEFPGIDFLPPFTYADIVQY